MSGRPLAGRRVVVARARTQSGSLVGRLEDLGAAVVELPVIAIDDPADGGAALADAAERLTSGAYEWVALTSSNAAARLLVALGGRAIPAGVQWAAVGTGTATTLAEAGLTADLIPTVSRAESLADAFPAPAPSRPGGVDHLSGASTKVLFPRAETVRGGLAPGLRAKGWEVDEVIAYRTVAGDPSAEAVRAATQADAVAFTSSSTVDHTVELLGASRVPAVVVTIGPATSSSVRGAGLSVSAEAEPHTLDGLVAALVGALGALQETTTGPGADASPTPPGHGPAGRLP